MMKKVFAVLLSVTLFAGMLSMFAFARDDDGWTTMERELVYHSQNKAEVVGHVTVSAKGNDIQIVITSDWINGDQLRCPGTKDAHVDELWGEAEGTILSVDFSDGTPDGGVSTNQLSFQIWHDCTNNPEYEVYPPTATTKPYTTRLSNAAAQEFEAETVDAHTISLRKNARLSLSYCFYREEADEYGNTSFYGAVAPGYSGYLGTSGTGIPNLHITTEGHTLTMTTTLPDQVVDYRNDGARDLIFKSDALQVGTNWGCYYTHKDPSPDTPPEKQTLIKKIIARVKAVFQKFVALFRKLFGKQPTAVVTERPAEYDKIVVFPNGKYVPVS